MDLSVEAFNKLSYPLAIIGKKLETGGKELSHTPVLG
jgi:hypothetical protein